MAAAQQPPKDAPYGAVTDAGFVWTAYNGTEAWFAIHQAADAVAARFGNDPSLALAVSVFHDVINVGLGKAPFRHPIAVLQRWLPPPGTRTALGVHRTPQLAQALPQALDELCEEVARVIRALVCCAHCRHHGTRWFCAFIDANRDRGRSGGSRYEARTRLEDMVAIQPQLPALHAHLLSLQERRVVPTETAEANGSDRGNRKGETAAGRRERQRGQRQAPTTPRPQEPSAEAEAPPPPPPHRAGLGPGERAKRPAAPALVPNRWTEIAAVGFRPPKIRRTTDAYAGPLALASVFAGPPHAPAP